MTLFQAIILGIVEGLTEFLPVSSTGHLILASRLLKIPSTDFLSSFEIAIQVGAILAVVALYGKSALLDIRILKRVLTAFFPTAIVGFFLYKLVKHVFFNSVSLVLWSLFLGGVFLIVFECFHPKKKTPYDLTTISYQQCFLIGLFQSLAVIPGVSRSAATIVGGLMLGLNRKVIVEFSFLLAIPTMLAATGFDIWKSGFLFSRAEADLFLAGFIVSFAVAFLSIRFFLYFTQRYDFTVFGIYRILLAVLLFFSL